MNDELKAGGCAVLVFILVIIGALCGLVIGDYHYRLYRAPMIEVYDGTELLYHGSEAFSFTESRGTSTVWYEMEATWFFPKKLNERISPNIRSKTIKEWEGK